MTLCIDGRCYHEHWTHKYGHDIGPHIHGDVQIGEFTKFCAPLDVNGKDSKLTIGSYCDIAAFVTISCADSHLRCIGLSPEIARTPITIGDNVFIGQGATILGGCEIGEGSVIGAGVVLANAKVPPRSRVRLPSPIIDAGYYAMTPEQREMIKAADAWRKMGLFS